METKLYKISELIPDPANARKHSVKNIDAIKGSLARFGQQKPIIIDKNHVVRAGNGTLEAAKQLGWTEIKAVQTSLEGSELTAYAIADNRTAELAEWDADILKETLSALSDEGFDFDALGFNDADFGNDKNTEGNTDPDEVPEIDENIFGVKRGDIWILGNHRLMCGDSTDENDVAKLMDGKNADMVFTDPPYGINLDTDYIKIYGGGSPTKGRKNHTGHNIKYKPINMDNVQFDPEFILKFYDYCDEIFLWGANYYWNSLPNNINSSIQVWDKRVTDNLRKMHGNQLELCWSKAKHQQIIIPITWCGAYGSDEGKAGHKKIHPTQKPIKLIEVFLDKWGSNKNLIIDLFMGSGSTLIACEKTGRICYGMEIDQHYCSVIIKRWQDFTGKQAAKLGGE